MHRLTVEIWFNNLDDAMAAKEQLLNQTVVPGRCAGFGMIHQAEVGGDELLLIAEPKAAS